MKTVDVNVAYPETTATQEIQAMSAVVDALEKLDGLARTRVATWLFDRYAAPELTSENSAPVPAGNNQVKLNFGGPVKP